MIIAISLLLAIGFYLLLSRNYIKIIFALMLLSSIINIIIFILGRINGTLPAFVGEHTPTQLSNPLPQALILTAIVIGFALMCYLCFLLLYLKREKESSES